MCRPTLRDRARRWRNSTAREREPWWEGLPAPGRRGGWPVGGWLQSGALKAVHIILGITRIVAVIGGVETVDNPGPCRSGRFQACVITRVGSVEAPSRAVEGNCRSAGFPQQDLDCPQRGWSASTGESQLGPHPPPTPSGTPAPCGTAHPRRGPSGLQGAGGPGGGDLVRWWRCGRRVWRTAPGGWTDAAPGTVAVGTPGSPRTEESGPQRRDRADLSVETERTSAGGGQDSRAFCLMRLVSSVTWLKVSRLAAMSSVIFLLACMTVVWSRPPKAAPIFGRDRSVSSRHRYIAI